MATCKDCIHEKVCVWNAELEQACNEDCSDFKNKADYAPVKRGKWRLNKDGSGTCSECGITSLAVWDYDNWQSFCGHCGADMRGA